MRLLAVLLPAQESQEPDVPTPEVKVRMPNLKNLRTVIDRMRHISEALSISAAANGNMCFQVQARYFLLPTNRWRILMNACVVCRTIS